MKILAIYDNGGRTFDRYTIVTNEKHGEFNDCLDVSDYPTHIYGVSLWGHCIYNTEKVNRHLGKRVTFEILTDELQTHIAGRVFASEGEAPIIAVT